MAGQYLNVEEVAQLLKMTNAEIVQLSNSGKIHGYRDGATWKYKKEAIEDYMKKQREAGKKPSDDDYGLDSYGDSDVGLSPVSDSDISLDVGDDEDDEDAILASPSSIRNNPPVDTEGDMTFGSSDINLTLDDDVSLEDSSLELNFDEDPDLVLGEEDGIGMGSGLALGEGSGISLMSANDSGISLEGDDGEVLELGDDDILPMSSSISGMGMDAEGDFDLMPKDDFGDEDDDSGSQVIPTERFGMEDDLDAGFGGGADMFSESMDGPTDEMGVLPSKQPTISDAGLPEKPYSILNILGLFFCFLILTLTLLFSVDLVRNMWSWDKPTQFNSAMMDWILNLIGGK